VEAILRHGSQRLCQAPGYLFWRQRAGKQRFPIEKKGGNARDAVPQGGFRFPSNFFGASGPVQDSSDRGFGKTSLFCNFAKNPLVAYIPSLGKVGAKQCFHHRIIAGFLTEVCVGFATLSALKERFEVFVAADSCGGLTPVSHEVALRI
jgi:hypothetical protein